MLNSCLPRSSSPPSPLCLHPPKNKWRFLNQSLFSLPLNSWLVIPPSWKWAHWNPPLLHLLVKHWYRGSQVLNHDKRNRCIHRVQSLSPGSYRRRTLHTCSEATWEDVLYFWMLICNNFRCLDKPVQKWLLCFKFIFARRLLFSCGNTMLLPNFVLATDDCQQQKCLHERSEISCYKKWPINQVLQVTKGVQCWKYCLYIKLWHL